MHTSNSNSTSTSAVAVDPDRARATNMFREKLAILNENFIRFLRCAYARQNSADMTPCVEDYLKHVRDLDAMYSTQTTISTSAIAAINSTTIAPAFSSVGLPTGVANNSTTSALITITTTKTAAPPTFPSFGLTTAAGASITTTTSALNKPPTYPFGSSMAQQQQIPLTSNLFGGFSSTTTTPLTNGGQDSGTVIQTSNEASLLKPFVPLPSNVPKTFAPAAVVPSPPIPSAQSAAPVQRSRKRGADTTVDQMWKQQREEPAAEEEREPPHKQPATFSPPAIAATAKTTAAPPTFFGLPTGASSTTTTTSAPATTGTVAPSIFGLPTGASGTTVVSAPTTTKLAASPLSLFGFPPPAVSSTTTIPAVTTTTKTVTFPSFGLTTATVASSTTTPAALTTTTKTTAPPIFGLSTGATTTSAASPFSSFGFPAPAASSTPASALTTTTTKTVTFPTFGLASGANSTTTTALTATTKTAAPPTFAFGASFGTPSSTASTTTTTSSAATTALFGITSPITTTTTKGTTGTVPTFSSFGFSKSPQIATTAPKTTAAAPPTFSFGLSSTGTSSTTTTTTASAFTANKPTFTFGGSPMAQQQKLFSGSLFGGFSASAATTNGGQGTTGADEVEADERPEEFVPKDDNFKPVVPLPPKVDVKSGEEEEEVCFTTRCKLYRFDREAKENRERGTGEFKILRHNKTGRYRCIVRGDEPTSKLLANFPITAQFKVHPGKAARILTWTCRDFSEKAEGVDETMLAKFNEPSIPGFLAKVEAIVGEVAAKK